MKAIDKLRAYWSKKENDIVLAHPSGSSTKSDGHFLSMVFSQEVTDFLASRGYDITTLRFSIEPKKGCQRFASQQQVPQ